MPEATLLQGITDGLVSLDHNWRYIYVNEAAATLLQTTPARMLGKIAWEVFPGLRDARLFEEFARAAREKVFVKVEDYYEPLGRWYECRCYPTEQGLTVLFSDTTGNKKIEEAMLESRQVLELAITGSNAGIWRIDLNPEKPGVMPDYVYLSPQLKALIGFENDEFPNSRSAWFDRIVPEDRPRLDEAAKAHAEGRMEMYQVEYRIRPKDGGLRWLSSRGRLYRDEFDRPLRWAGVDTDITDQREAQEQMGRLREQAEQAAEQARWLGRIPEESPNPVLRISNENIMLYSNPTAEKLCEYWGCWTGQRVPPVVEVIISHALAAGAVTHHEILCGDRTFWLAVAPCPTEDYVNIYARDVTERNRMEQSLQAANEQLRASNEELRAQREELETANEELQAQREELQVQAEELRAQEQTLREAHERAAWLARFPQENPNPVLRVSADGKILYRNPAAMDLPGWACEVGHKSPKALLSLVTRALEQGQQIQQDMELGGTPYAVWVTPIPSEGYANVYGRDITAQKRAQEALQKAHDELENRVRERTADLMKTLEMLAAERKRFYDVLETLPAYLVLLTPDHHVSFANRFFRERFGESHGKRCFEYLFHRTEPCEVCDTYEVLKTNAPHRWEWTGPDGRIYDIYDFPFTDADGSPLIMEMGIDITERRHAEAALKEANETLEQRVEERTAELQETNEQLHAQTEELQAQQEELQTQAEELRAQAQELRESEGRFRLLFEQSMDAIIVTDPSGGGTILSANPAACRMLGWTEAELIGKGRDVLFDLEDPNVTAMLKKRARAGSARVELLYRRKDGSTFPGEVNSALFTDSGGCRRAVAIIRDMTAQKQTEEEARKEHRETAFANRVLRAFAECEGDELFDRALAIIQEEMASQYGVFGYIAEPGHLICPSLSKMLKGCEVEGKCIHYPPEKWKGLWARALKEKRSSYTNEAPRVPPGHPIIHNNLAAPILFHGEAIGLLNLSNKEGGYGDEDREMLDAIAARVAPVLYAWIQRKLREDEREEAQEEVRRLAQQRQLALDAARLGWWRYDPITRIASWDDGYREIFGMTGYERPVDEILTQVIHPDDRSGLWAKVEAALDPADAQPFAAEYRIHRPDGQMRWVEAHGIATFEDAGGDRQATSFVGTVADISERKQAEEALRESEQRLRLALEGGRMGLWEWDLETDRSYWNERMYELLGLDPYAQASHERLLQHVDPRDVEPLNESVRQSLAEGGDFQMEFRLVRLGGEVAWVSSRGKVIRNMSGKAVRMLGVLYDITQRRLMEEQLRRLNDRLETEIQAQTRELRDTIDRLQDEVVRRVLAEGKLRKSSQMLEGFFQHSITPLAFLDRHFNFMRVNEAYARAAGQTPEFFKGKNHFDLYPNDENKAIFKMVVRTGRLYRARAKPFTYPDRPHEVTYWDWQLTPLRNERGEVQHLVLNLQDVTQQQEAVNELEHRAYQLQKLTLELSQAEDRERRRMAEVLHDGLQQQLAAAKFHLGLLSTRAKNDAGMQEIAMQLDSMLRDAIEQSRSLSHELSPAVLYQSDLGETFEWLARQMQSKHGLSVHTEVHGRVDSPSESMKAFLFRTGQELLFNAVKHAKVKEARLRLQRKGERLWLTIADQGRGFDPKTLGRTAGFGLLSIRERVGLLGGRMKIRSVPGKGSAFLIAVPDAEAAEETRQPAGRGRETVGVPSASGLGPAASGGRLRVLLVDDHKVMREGLAALISEQQDMEIVGQAGDGGEAVELARALQPDIVIMDVAMPVMAGDEATRHIKAQLPRTHIIALSMFAEPGVREKMLDAGASAYLAKTGPSEEFLAAIRQSTTRD